MTRGPETASRSVEWDGYAEAWLTEKPQRIWRRHSDALNARLIRKWLPGERMDLIVKTDLFDEAVTGGLYTTLLERAVHVAAIDVSPIVTTAARAKHPAMLAAAGDIRDTPLRSRCADAVVSLSTLDHFDSVDDIPLALMEIYRILKPGGVLVLTMDNPSNPILAVRNSLPYSATHRAGLVPYPVGKTHGVKTMSRLIEEAGLDITDRTAIMHAPRMAAIQALRLARGDHGGPRRTVAKTLMAFETLERLPTRYFTGHFIAVRAIKPFKFF
jgi:SAM-dependent methyltransferase